MRVANMSELEKRFGMIPALKMNFEAGFDAVDVSFHYLKGALWQDGSDALIREMKSIADAFGAVFNQAHAPFPSYQSGDSEEIEAYNRKTPEQVKRAIEMAGKLGVPHIVIHPIALPNATTEEMLAFNLEHIGQFLPYAKDAGVRIALENMWGHHRDCFDRIVENVCSTGAELLRFVEAFHDPYIVPLIDVGHAGLVGTTADRMIREVGRSLAGLHLHDNDFFRDTHTLPFLSKMEYEEMIRALIDIEYTGDVTFEVGDAYYGHIPDALMPDALRFQYRIGAYFRDRITSGIAEKRK